ncbi:TPA: hypothetical protein DDZ86_01120 [Candidatus Dependentiae bacterium]|nr:hypothetical protein [Candidatus Dependentiae bacterium]
MKNSINDKRPATAKPSPSGALEGASPFTPLLLHLELIKFICIFMHVFLPRARESCALGKS